MLATRGLAAALKARARAGPGDVVVVSGPGVDGVRFPEDVELAAYFACLEALQNAAKHAPGAEVVLSLAAAGDVLCFTIADDGPGFDVDASGGGTGLVGMRDRLGAVGGSLSIVSDDRGTRIRGELPMDESRTVPGPHRLAG